MRAATTPLAAVISARFVYGWAGNVMVPLNNLAHSLKIRVGVHLLCRSRPSNPDFTWGAWSYYNL